MKAGGGCIFDYVAKDQKAGLFLTRTLGIVRKLLYEHNEDHASTSCPVKARGLSKRNYESRIVKSED